MRKINKIIVHCSDSNWGNAAVIDEWHKARGWKCIGYHYVILNGKLLSSDFNKEFDGTLEEGRPVERPGSHVKGMNADTIGICLIGIDKFTPKQYKTLRQLLFYLCSSYNLERSDILGHCETPTGKAQGKTCPNIKMQNYRIRLKLYFTVYTYGFFTPSIIHLLG